MIEAYAFLAMFAVQILATSVLYPAWFIRYWRRQTATIPPERLTELYPGVDPDLVSERYLARYRRMSSIVAVMGLLLFGWLFSYTQRPDWNDGPVEVLVSVYFLMQMVLPVGVVLWLAIRFNKAHKRPSLEGKRKAVLQRRELFDFVSPFVVFLAALSYLLFAAFVIYLQQHPFLGFAGLVNIGAITLVYALNAFIVYQLLYGKKPNPFESHAGRVHTIRLAVKSSVYSCIACVVFISLNLTLSLLDWQRWEPFALSAFFVLTALLGLMGMTAPPRQARAAV
jgi:hypothetical protein